MTIFFAWLRVALRDLRGDLSHFGVLLACLALGVGAIAAVGSVGEALQAAIARDSRLVLGGDLEGQLSYRRGQRRRARAVRQARHLCRSHRRRRPGAHRRRELVHLDEGRRRQLSAARRGRGRATRRTCRSPSCSRPATASTASSSTASSSTAWGSTSATALEIGDAKFEVRGVLDGLPDQATQGFQIGVPTLTSIEGLTATGLIHPGALARYRYKIAPRSRRHLRRGARSKSAAPSPTPLGRPLADRRDRDPRELLLDLHPLPRDRRPLVAARRRRRRVERRGRLHHRAPALDRDAPQPRRHQRAHPHALPVPDHAADAARHPHRPRPRRGPLADRAADHRQPALDPARCRGPPVVAAAPPPASASSSASPSPSCRSPARNRCKPALLFRVRRRRGRTAGAGAMRSSRASGCRCSSRPPGIDRPRAADHRPARARVLVHRSARSSRSSFCGSPPPASSGSCGGSRRCPTPTSATPSPRSTGPAAPAPAVILSLGLGLALLLLIALIENNLRTQIETQVQADAPSFILTDLFPDEADDLHRSWPRPTSGSRASTRPR